MEGLTIDNGFGTRALLRRGYLPEKKSNEFSFVSSLSSMSISEFRSADVGSSAKSGESNESRLRFSRRRRGDRLAGFRSGRGFAWETLFFWETESSWAEAIA